MCHLSFLKKMRYEVHGDMKVFFPPYLHTSHKNCLMSPLTLSKTPPGPTTLSPFGQLFEFRKDSLAFLQQLAEEHGDIAQFRLGPIKVLLVNHPDYIREVLSTQNSNFVKGRPLDMAKELLGEGLLTSEGEHHKRQSRIIQPAFHRRMVESYAPAVTEYAVKLMDKWDDGQEVEIMEEMVKMSTAIAGKAFFNADLEAEAPGINQALEDVMSLFGRVTMPFSELILKLPLPDNLRFFRAKKLLDTTIDRIIARRKQHPEDQGDLLSMLLNWRDEDGLPMQDQHVHDEALTLLLTAFDTTSLALTWTWYLLSQHPEAEQELHQEIDQLLGGRLPTMEDYHKLTYTRMVMGESMRLYPPLYLVAREALDDFSLGEYRIPKGTLVLVSPYLMQRDKRFFIDPDQFSPHNWGEHEKSTKSKYEYFPFSMGPRACIGQPFAWLEGILALATIGQHWRLELVPGHRVELDQVLNLRPKFGMKMRVFRRESVDG